MNHVTRSTISNHKINDNTYRFNSISISTASLANPSKVLPDSLSEKSVIYLHDFVQNNDTFHAFQIDCCCHFSSSSSWSVLLERRKNASISHAKFNIFHVRINKLRLNARVHVGIVSSLAVSLPIVFDTKSNFCRHVCDITTVNHFFMPIISGKQLLTNLIVSAEARWKCNVCVCV